MTLFINKIINKYFIVNFLFSSLIVSFIAGNLIINLNVLLIICTVILIYKKKIFEIDLDYFDKILIFFFIYILICSLINNINYYKNGITDSFSIFLKSVFFLRFLIFYFVTKFLIQKKIINFKVFFITAFVSVVFVCLDIIYQYAFGFDIFGFEATERRLSGPFGEELIAGSYIQRFSLITLFLIPIFFKFKKKYTNYIVTIFLILLLLITLILSGNRIPLAFFIFTVAGIIIFEKSIRIFFIPVLIILISIIYLTYNISEDYRNHLHGFGQKSLQILLPFSSKNVLKENEEEKYKDYQFFTYEYKGKTYKITNSHLKEFKTGYATWLYKKNFGGGIKSFKLNCPRAETMNCGSHPHNYYLEILASLGLFGFILLFIIFFIAFIKTFVKKYFKSSSLNNFHLITPFIFLFFSEIFPIKSTGSFFSTANATYIFLLLSIMMPLSKIKKFD